jgi:DNA-binding MarR family transcriptional regulator
MSTESQQTTDSETTSTLDHTDLTAFQVDVLAVTARLEGAVDQVYGLAIKRGLEDIRDQDINHGTLYPNLDDLVEDGLIEKGEIDARTNSYRVTREGFRLLQQRRDHLSIAIDGGV